MRRAFTMLAAMCALAVQLSTSAGASPEPGDQKVFRYEIDQRGDVDSDMGQFAAVVRMTLDDNRGWRRAGLEFRPVSSGGDFRVVLASPDEVEAVADVCSRKWSCRVGNQVLINDERWQEGASAWTETLREYRRYVVNHEVGHWLGLGHEDCPKPGRPASVMQQQSIDLQGCTANVWQLQREIEAVADMHDTRVDAASDHDEPAVTRGHGDMHFPSTQWWRRAGGGLGSLPRFGADSGPAVK